MRYLTLTIISLILCGTAACADIAGNPNLSGSFGDSLPGPVQSAQTRITQMQAPESEASEPEQGTLPLPPEAQSVMPATPARTQQAQQYQPPIRGQKQQLFKAQPTGQVPQIILPQSPPAELPLLQKDARPQSSRPQPHPATAEPTGTVNTELPPLLKAPQIQDIQPPQLPYMRRSVASTGMISLNFDDADVFSVIQTVFGDILRVNYVVDPRVKGRVTFRSVAPVSKSQVLPVMEVILRINGIGVAEESGLYRIVPLSDVSREPSRVSFGRDASKIPATGKSLIQVVPIVYLQSTEIVQLITPFVSANAVVLDVPKSNQVIIVDTDASIRRILNLIETFDNESQKRKRAQVFVYPVQNGKAKDIAGLLQQIFLGSKTGTGVTSRPSTALNSAQQATSLSAQALTQPAQTGGGAGGESLVADITRIFFAEVINSIIVLATPEDYQTIKETISKIDIAPRQVVIEGVVASVNLTDDLSLGIAYSMGAHISFSNTKLQADLGVNSDSLSKLPANTVSKSGFAFVGTDNRGVVRAFVNALATESKAKLLAAPHILVSDNKEARIQVGQQVPIVTSETFGSGTVAPQRTIQYKDIGVILKVKPQVNESSLVSLEISQEVSTYETIKLFSDETEIILNKAEANTSLVVQDGQTIIIGGLIREDASNARTGVPFIQRIPILGYLFGNTDNKFTRQEIIILLTPHVIKNPTEARSITKDYIDNIAGDETTRGGLKKEELIKGGVKIRKDSSNIPDTIIPHGDMPSSVETSPAMQPLSPDTDIAPPAR
jgi:type II secretory pathway component GspD/PulD (secretin)